MLKVRRWRSTGLIYTRTAIRSTRSSSIVDNVEVVCVHVGDLPSGNVVTVVPALMKLPLLAQCLCLSGCMAGCCSILSYGTRHQITKTCKVSLRNPGILTRSHVPLNMHAIPAVTLATCTHLLGYHAMCRTLLSGGLPATLRLVLEANKGSSTKVQI